MGCGCIVAPSPFKQIDGRQTPSRPIPESGVFLFWEPGNPLLNKVMAVGVAEIIKSKRPLSCLFISSEIHGLWGEAKPLRSGGQ